MSELPCWVLAEERLPDVDQVKNEDKGWLVWDGVRVYYTTTHPGWWNLKGKFDDGTPIDAPVVVKWLDAPQVM